LKSLEYFSKAQETLSSEGYLKDRYCYQCFARVVLHPAERALSGQLIAVLFGSAQHCSHFWSRKPIIISLFVRIGKTFETFALFTSEAG